MQRSFRHLCVNYNCSIYLFNHNYVSIVAIHNNREAYGVSIVAIHDNREAYGVSIVAIHDNREAYGVSSLDIHNNRGIVNMSWAQKR